MAISVISRPQSSRADGGLPECPQVGETCGHIGKRPPGSAWRWRWATRTSTGRRFLRSYRALNAVNPRKSAAGTRYARRWGRRAVISVFQHRANIQALAVDYRYVRVQRSGVAIPGNGHQFSHGSGGELPECPPAGKACGHIGFPPPRIPESRRQAPKMPASPRLRKHSTATSGPQRREFPGVGGRCPECPLAGEGRGHIEKRPPGSAWRWRWAPGMPAGIGGGTAISVSHRHEFP